MKDGRPELIEGIIIILLLIISFGIFNHSVKADENQIQSKNLSAYIMESGSGRDGSSSAPFGEKQGVTQKLGWVSDVMTNRNNIFTQSSNYDFIEDDPMFAKRMLRRAGGKEMVRITQESELKEVYQDVSDFFRQAQELFAVNEGLSTTSHVKKSGKNGPKKRIMVLGIDAGNQFSPTMTIYDNLKVSYQPMSQSLLTQIGWEF